MRRATLVLAAAGALMLALPAVPPLASGAAVPSDETVPLYTNEDLERMFGPAGAGSSGPVDRSTPEDWRWVEEFLARQYARIDADRQDELQRRSLAIDAGRPVVYGGYPGAVALGLGYPASVWWSTVWWKYTNALHTRPPSLAPPPPPRPHGPAMAPRGGPMRGPSHAPPSRGGRTGPAR